MADDRLHQILNDLRVTTDPAALAFLPDEENQNLMLRNLPAAVLIRDAAEAVILEANEYALRMFGVERQILVGSTLSDLGLGIHFYDQLSSSQASGDPRNGRITDSQGVEIPAILFTRKIDISGRQADLFIIIDGTLLGGSDDRSQAPRYSILKQYLNVLSQGYIIVEIAGTAVEQDLLVVEASERLPEGLKGPVSPGRSISEIVPGIEAAGLVETAITASRNSSVQSFESGVAGRIDVFPGRTSLVLLCFAPPEREKPDADHIRTTESKLSSAVIKTILFLCSDSQDLDSGTEMLKMLGFSVVEVSSPVEALKEFVDTPGRFLFVMADLETVQPETLELMRSIESAGKHIILAGNEPIRDSSDIPPGVKLVFLRKPYGINDLASAISVVTD